MSTVRLPTASRTIETYRLGPASPFPNAGSGTFPRIAYAAAHVVADPLADLAPWYGAAVDWDATMAFRRHLWGLGFKIAEAMDTSQRGMGFDWASAKDGWHVTVTDVTTGHSGTIVLNSPQDGPLNPVFDVQQVVRCHAQVPFFSLLAA